MKAIILSAGALAALVAGVVAFTLCNTPEPGPLPAFRSVTLDDGRVLHVQAQEVDIALWNRCHAAGACPFPLTAPDAGQDHDYPATGLSWTDVGDFTEWFSAETGHPFRLPTMAEWREVSHEVLPDAPEPLFTAPELSWASAYQVQPEAERRLRPSGQGSVTRDGIADLANNVWEWTADCVRQSDPARCPAYFAGGLHEAVIPYLVRDPARGGCATGIPPAHLGMRLVSDRPLS